MHDLGLGVTASKNPTPVAEFGALALALVFALVQAWTIDYGTRFNDVAHIRNFVFDGAALSGAFERQVTVIAVAPEIPESAGKAAMRFKLYSVNPDEHMAIMALSRMKPREFDFNPDYYQYGGAFLYPLGLWYFVLSKAGIIEVGSLEEVLKSPDGLDEVYVAGRVFVLIAFLLSALVLYRTFRIVGDPWSATWALGIYLFVPATIVFSVVTKPHWYALLWVCGGLYVLVRAWQRHDFRVGDELALGVLGGLALASVPLNPGPALLLGFAVLAAVRDGSMNPRALFRIPLAAFLAFFATSPYFVIDLGRLGLETSQSTGWVDYSIDPERIWGFFATPLVLGFGLAFVLLLLGLWLYRLATGRGPVTWWAAALLAGPILFYAYVTQGLDGGALSYRYLGFMVPIALLVTVSRPWPHRRPVLAAVFVLTVLQTVPLKIAYVDENDPLRGTRLAAAAWVSAEVPAGSSVCAGTARPSPYRMPPLDVARYRLHGPDCGYHIVVGDPKRSPAPDGYERVKEFAPRGWHDSVAVIHANANPFITIYRRLAPATFN
ncbi:MAG: glycosyltransferase family 39 protein [Alphaproteobacteria bacterium]|nr:glycosyltransferase family 39 protein [Alphaproteobacteria bacterium]